jgi:hypothetical protein
VATAATRAAPLTAAAGGTSVGCPGVDVRCAALAPAASVAFCRRMQRPEVWLLQAPRASRGLLGSAALGAAVTALPGASHAVSVVLTHARPPAAAHFHSHSHRSRAQSGSVCTRVRCTCCLVAAPHGVAATRSDASAAELCQPSEGLPPRIEHLSQGQTAGGQQAKCPAPMPAPRHATYVLAMRCRPCPSSPMGMFAYSHRTRLRISARPCTRALSRGANTHCSPCRIHVSLHVAACTEACPGELAKAA